MVCFTLHTVSLMLKIAWKPLEMSFVPRPRKRSPVMPSLAMTPCAACGVQRQFESSTKISRAMQRVRAEGKAAPADGARPEFGAEWLDVRLSTAPPASSLRTEGHGLHFQRNTLYCHVIRTECSVYFILYTLYFISFGPSAA